MKQAPVVIVGGGVSGLASAYTLARRSVEFRLIEKEQRLGGTIRTERHGGFLLDAGPDAFLTQKPEALALCREIGLGSRLIPTNPAFRTVWVLFRGRLHPLPEGMVLTVPTRLLPFAVSSLFSPLGKIRMGLELFVPPRRDRGEESIASFIRRRLGRQALERLAEPLLAGIHSGEPDRLSMDQLFPRFVEMETRYGSLIRGMRKARPPRASGAPTTLFMSLSGGLVELVDALAANLPEGACQLGTEVRRILRQGSGWVVETSSGEATACRSLVLATPLRAAMRLVEGFSSHLARALEAFRSVSTAVVFLGFPRCEVRHPLNGYGFVVPRQEGRRILAATFVSTKFPNRASGTDVLMRAFFGGARDPDVLGLSDEELTNLARQDLGEVLGGLGAPSFSKVYRWEEATPQVEVGHGDRLARLEESLSQLPGLYVTGNGLRGVGIPDCIADGRRVAESASLFLSRSATHLGQ